ncbi:M1 family metallopeptidase [Hyalangium sp.]|uniref:M1 family metallopeptidase n=1 Tax=Hyalangium sp. TaxID=2028555 RepID=UPI002D6BA678|nr:M1 family aminopeptidase [Hyalangium sp.]HYI00263.1 M1 family aminopeptidase [Hyalangium sp.]
MMTLPPLRPVVWVLVPLLCAACATTAPTTAPTSEPSTPIAEAAPARTEPLTAPTPPELRLPKTARPLRYAAELTVIPTQDSFQGKIDIDLEVTEATSLLWLNATELKVSSAQLSLGGTTLAARVVPGDRDFVGFAFERPIGPGLARLSISYEGLIDKERTRGLYREQEKEAWYAYTLFQPVDARRVFPCFDEPEFKVPWRLRLRVRAGDVALANTPVESQGAPLADGTKVVTFAETKPLPSYLIAFVVGPFEVVDAGTFGRSQTPLRFILPQGRRGELGYALKVTPRLVTALEDYFDMAYPFGKLDVAVVPRYQGTLEHPGLVALGQPLTLIPPKEETLPRQQMYARIAIHELAHYWFGDYVTMAWWDELWLNESSATWLEAKLIDRLEPSWKEQQDRLWEHLSALSTDGLASSRPMRQPLTSRTDFESAFDNSITYFKGSAVLGMFESWLGEETFQRGIRRFMHKHAWSTATSADLLAALSAESGRDVATAMSTFIDQPGAPLVSVELECAPGKPPRLKLAQARFFASPPKSAPPAQRWYIPLCVRYGGAGPQGRACTLLTEPEGELVLSEAKACPAWIAANEEARGYYRVAYSEPLRQKLVKADLKPLTPRERGAFLADLRVFASTGRLPIGEALAMLPKLLREQDRASTEAGLAMLGLLRPVDLPDEWLPHYQRLVHALVVPRARALGWRPRPGEDEDTRRMRNMLVGTAAISGRDAALLAEARELAKAWLKDPSAVAPDSVDAVLFVAAFASDRAFFDAVLSQAKKEEQPEKRGLLLAVLGSFRDPGLAREALGLMVDGTFSPRDSLGLLFSALNRRETRAVAYAFVKEHFDMLAEGMTAMEASQVLFGVPGVFCDKASRDDAAAFFSPRASGVDGAPLVLARSLERVDLCVASWERNKADITAFLRRY